MATIQERAENYANTTGFIRIVGEDYETVSRIKIFAYTKGATEQQAIDIDKAKQFSEKWFDEIANLWLHELKEEPYRTQAIESIFKKLEKAMTE